MKNHNKPKYMFVKVQGAYLCQILIIFWLIYGIIDMITSGHTSAEQAITMGDNTGSLRCIACTAFTDNNTTERHDNVYTYGHNNVLGHELWGSSMHPPTFENNWCF